MVLFVLFLLLGLATAEICYVQTGIQSACCSEENRYYRRCHGDSQPIAVCKDWCDKNVGCLGYVGTTTKGCQVAITAATTVCPTTAFRILDASNSPASGIAPASACGSIYTGCNIKVTTTGSCAQMTTTKAVQVTTPNPVATTPCPQGLLWATEHACSFCSDGTWFSSVSTQADCQTLAINNGMDHYTYKNALKKCRIPTSSGGCTSTGVYADCAGNVHARNKGCAAAVTPATTLGPVGAFCNAAAEKACELANRVKCIPSASSACGDCLPGFPKVSDACVDVSACKDTSVLPSKAVFVMDMSGSVGAANFAKMKDLTLDLVSVLPLQEFSFLAFSTSHVEYPGGGKFANKAEALNLIPTIRYGGGGTYTAKAIKLTQARLQDDLESFNMVLVLTDGKAGDPSALPAEAKKLLETKDRNGTVTVVAVGFGSVDSAELKLIAGGEENTIIAAASGATAGFIKLQSLVSTLVNNVCINLPVDCVVEYGPYGPCGKTCGFSYQTREIANIILPKNGGKACPHGKNLRAAVKAICDEPDCPIDCGIKWGKWFCEGDKESRKGTIESLAEFGGVACTGKVGDNVYEYSDSCGNCGDGERTTGEDCDDNNNENGDGCSKFCKIESGFVCTVQTSLPDKCEVPDLCKTQSIDCGGTSVCVNGKNTYTCECAEDYSFFADNTPCTKYFVGGDLGCKDCIDTTVTVVLKGPYDPYLPGWLLTGNVQRSVAGNNDLKGMLPPPGGDPTMVSIRKSSTQSGSISKGSSELKVGHRYIVEWYQRDGTSDAYVGDMKVNASSTTSDNGWTRRTAIFVAQTTNPAIKIQTESATDVLIDSIVVKRDPTFSTTTIATTISTSDPRVAITTQPASSSVAATATTTANDGAGTATTKATVVNDDDGAHAFTTFTMPALMFGFALAFLLQD